MLRHHVKKAILRYINAERFSNFNDSINIDKYLPILDRKSN